MKTRIFAVLLLAVLLVTSMMGCSFELSDDDVDYLSLFERDVDNYTFELSTLNVENYKMKMDTYLNNDEADVFYVDNESEYKSKCYKYIVVTVKTACVLDEIAMYIKWDKSTSGALASGPLSVQLFKVPSATTILTAQWIKSVLIAMAKGEVTPEMLYKTTDDAVMPLKDGQWNDGVLASIKGFDMAAGDKVVIKFPQNCDFVDYEYDMNSDSDDENSKYSFTEKSDNNVSFKLDKLMFHIA